jgi:glycosyltransferase involved in cell wall biosynthesis
MRTLHVVVPHYEEPRTVAACLERVVAVTLPLGWTMGVQVVDDGSTPEAVSEVARVIESLAAAGHPVGLVRHPVNRGKGAAVRTGFDRALSAADPGDLVIIQDADLEYDPADYPALMGPVIEGRADAVVGTRWGPHRPVSGITARVHRLGNRSLTVLSNLACGGRVTDMECCYKLFTPAILARILPRLTEERFGIEPQIMAALAREGARVTEVPVRYDPRGFAAGKKIGVRDLIRAIWVILRERFAPAAGRRPEAWSAATGPGVGTP